MTAVEWSEWVRHRRAMAGAAAFMARRTAPRGRRSGRPRTSEEREMIVRGTVALMHKREREGRLVRVGPNRYELGGVSQNDRPE